jgi:isoleucyl-tRNA synthetase
MDDNKTPKSEVALREETTLKFWLENHIFEKSIEKDASAGNFVFYDGPPFATGLPHYGHVLPGTMKDVIPRYQTMKGFRVLRRWGWDCHGLPVENMIEKELGLKNKKDIEIYGIDKFNAAARAAVFRYTDEWKKIIPRVGRWVDMEHDYRTMDKTYTESVWWSFKTLHDKNLVYKDFKVMYLCPHCGTTLSNFEVNLGYKDITDISVYVEFELIDEPNTYLIAWTTTPWTLPGNMALAVNKDIEYVKAEKDGKYFIVAKSVVEKVLKENYSITEEFKGKNLVGKSYKPIFDYYNNDKLENRENAWKVYASDFVLAEEGTGIVHIAPAFGEEDLNLSRENSIPFVQHVGMDGLMKPEVTDFAGLSAKPKSADGEKDGQQKTDIEVIKILAANGVLFAKEKIIHSYPHCWRCETPLLNYATTSWFVKVTDLKEKMVALNKKITWVPEEIGSGRFGKWLEGARDWAVSRARYWGAPLPVWISEDEKFVAGSVEELKLRIKKRNGYFLVRHGESENNLNGDIISSHVDVYPLTEKGKEESKKTGNVLKNKKVDVIISSPILRTKETAEVIAKEMGFTDEIIFDDRLSEISGGEYEGKLWDEYLENFPVLGDRFSKRVGTAENWDDVRRRVMEFLYEIDQTYEGKNILIVSHGGPLNLIMLGARGFSVSEMGRHYTDGDFANAEMKEADFRQLPKNENFEIDLHRPFIDDIRVYSQDGQLMKRVPDVFDTWYDSGSMPYASQHYPFENKELFEQKNSPLFPADFIAEGLDQTRGWFYTLLILSTGLFEKSPYEHVIVNGLILAEDGRKMSKSLKNYPDLNIILDKYGADALRYYLMSSAAVEGEDLNFFERGVDEIYKKIILKLGNVVSFYELYKTDDMPETKGNILDQWIVSRLHELTSVTTKYLDEYKLDRASRPILDFVDDLSTWYVRRSRDRFKSDNLEEKNAALYHTRHILVELSKIIAPFMPFLAEEIYQKVKTSNDPESVHLATWPSDQTIDQELLHDMQRVRETVTVVLEARAKANIKVRQPLASLVIKEHLSMELRNILAEEVNVKELVSDETLTTPYELDITITPELQVEGNVRDFIRAVQEARKVSNLTPSDVITLSIETDSTGQKFVEDNSEAIKKPTNVGSFVFGAHAGKEFEISNLKFKIEIK